MNNSHTHAASPTHTITKSYVMLRPTRRGGGVRQDGVAKHTFAQPCKYLQTCAHVSQHPARRAYVGVFYVTFDPTTATHLLATTPDGLSSTFTLLSLRPRKSRGKLWGRVCPSLNFFTSAPFPLYSSSLPTFPPTIHCDLLLSSCHYSCITGGRWMQ